MITALLERMLRWLDKQSCTFELDGPVIMKDQGSWLRISPDGSVRWFAEEWQALCG